MGGRGMVGNSVGIYRPVGAHPLQIWTSGVLLQNRNTQFTMERDQLCYGGKVIHFIKCGPDWRFCKREIQRVQRDEIQSTTKYKYTIILSTRERYTMCNEIRSNLLQNTNAHKTNTFYKREIHDVQRDQIQSTIYHLCFIGHSHERHHGKICSKNYGWKYFWKFADI